MLPSVTMIEVALQALLYDLLSPFTFAPAAAIGWIARTRGQRWAAVGALAIAKIAFVLSRYMPANLFHAVVIVVTQAIAPLLWVFGVAALRAQLSGPAAAANGQPATARWVRGLIGAVLGGPAGGAIGALLGSIAADLLSVSNVDGGSGYFVAFFGVIPGILLGLVAGPILALRTGPRPAQAS
jgi:hypothetical protein